MRNAECGVRSAECGVRSAECGVRNERFEGWRVKGNMKNVERGAWSVERNIFLEYNKYNSY